MPPRSKGPYLYLKRGPDRSPVWIIRDGRKRVRTGCDEGAVDQARLALADYIQAQHAPERRERRLSDVPVADVIAIYAADRVAASPRARQTARRLDVLNDFWGGKSLAEVTGRNCRAYVAWLGSEGGARRDLQDLSAAIQHHHREGYHRETIRVALPPRGMRRETWLTRDEVARLLWACWRAREHQNAVATGKHPLRHIARFVLMAYYTASRPGACLTASIVAASGRSVIDMDQGVFYRLAEGKAATNKRQPPVRLPNRLHAHLERWARIGVIDAFVVDWRGKPVASVKTGFARAVRLAQLPAATTPYTLRHTSITHMMQRGVPIWIVAGFAGTSEAMIRLHYGHHHPDHMREATDALDRRGATSGRKQANKDATRREQTPRKA